MLQAKMRHIAMQAARSKLLANGIDPATVGSYEAFGALDDLRDSEPELIASEWYEKASGAQIRMFRHEWRMRRRQCPRWN